MIRKIAIYSAVVLAVAIVLGIVFRGRITTWLHEEKAIASSSAAKSANAPSERKVLYYYDAMNPQHHYDKAGKAPDGMDLVAKYADEGSPTGGSMANMPGTDMSQSQGAAPTASEQEMQGMQNMAPGTVMLNPATQQLIGVTYTTARRAPLVRTVRTVGLVQMDDEKISHIHVKVPGWVQDIGVDYVGQLVKKGQFLFSLYSPDLVSTEQEYLIALRGEDYLGKAPYRDVSEGAQSLLRATRDRLRLWDINDEQIDKLEKTRDVERYMKFYSPVSGFVTDRKAFPQSWVDANKELYTLADLSTVWVYVDIYEYEAPYVRLGQKASMQLSYFAGRTFSGRVTYIYPTLDPQTRTIKVRLEFPNPNFELKPNMYGDVELKINYGTQLLVPSQAVLNSGTRQIVYMSKPDGYFEPREIKVGSQFDDQYQVLAGLKPGEKIVASGNFLIDSESRLGAAMQAMSASMPGMSSSNAPATANAPGPQAQVKFSTEPSPPAKGTNVVRVHLADAQGAGIAGAAVQVTFFMAGMPSMGMPPMRIVSSLNDQGEGNYQGTIQLSSGGNWQVAVIAQRGGQPIATRQLAVTATGGM